MRRGLVLGGAACVFDDVAAAAELCEFDVILGVNYIGIHWPGRFDAWVTIHGDRLRLWAERRRRRGLPAHKALIGPEQAALRFPGQDRSGSSSLFAVKVALDVFGCDRVVVCGAPLSPDAAHFDDPARWDIATYYREGWQQARIHINDKVRSMSGWTADLLGKPDAQFIGGQ